jgi:hypothetical protein
LTKKQKPKYERLVINSLDEIPEFADEDEDREYWWTHEFSDELWDSLPVASDELDEILPLPDGKRSRRKPVIQPSKP